MSQLNHRRQGRTDRPAGLTDGRPSPSRHPRCAPPTAAARPPRSPPPRAANTHTSSAPGARSTPGTPPGPAPPRGGGTTTTPLLRRLPPYRLHHRRPRSASIRALMPSANTSSTSVHAASVVPSASSGSPSSPHECDREIRGPPVRRQGHLQVERQLRLRRLHALAPSSKAASHSRVFSAPPIPSYPRSTESGIRRSRSAFPTT